MGNTIRKGVRALVYAGVLWTAASCGRSRTESLLVGKTWRVTDVTPPPGVFNVEEANRAEELKDGFYRGAWFRFLADSVFVASLGGKTDTGRYHINATGKVISLYPKGSARMYEQIRIRELTAARFSFNTVLADFHLVLHLEAGDAGRQTTPP